MTCAIAVHYYLCALSIGIPSTGETQESMNIVSCRRDMTEILLKAA